MKEKNLEGADVRDRRKGRKEVVNVEPPRPEWEKTKRKKKETIRHHPLGNLSSDLLILKPNV